MASPKTKKIDFTGNETIADVLFLLPEASDILLSHGLSCVSCAFNVHEPLKEGVLGHGYSEEDFTRILDDLNEAANDVILQSHNKDSFPTMTSKAQKKVQDFQKESGQEGFGFKIDVVFSSDDKEVSYFLDFLEKPERGDRVLPCGDVLLFLNTESWKFLQNCTIDFAQEGGDEGFVIEKKTIPLDNGEVC